MVFMVYMVFRHCMIFQLRKTDWWKGTSWTRMRRRKKDLSLSVETKWVGDSKCFKLIRIPLFLLLITKQIQHFFFFFFFFFAIFNKNNWNQNICLHLYQHNTQLVRRFCPSCLPWPVSSFSIILVFGTIHLVSKTKISAFLDRPI